MLLILHRRPAILQHLRWPSPCRGIRWTPDVAENAPELVHDSLSSPSSPLSL